VARTITWARRCKEEFTRGINRRKQDGGPRPLLFGVVQVPVMLVLALVFALVVYLATS